MISDQPPVMSTSVGMVPSRRPSLPVQRAGTWKNIPVTGIVWRWR